MTKNRKIGLAIIFIPLAIIFILYLIYIVVPSCVEPTYLPNQGYTCASIGDTVKFFIFLMIFIIWIILGVPLGIYLIFRKNKPSVK